MGAPESEVKFKPIRTAPRGPDLWGTFYAALWLNATLLAALAYWPSAGRAGLTAIALWAAALAVTAALACLGRTPLHDLLVSLSERERLYLGLIIAIVFFLPVFSGDRILFSRRLFHVLTRGFLFVTPAMIMMAVKAPMARRLLAVTLVGAWFDALFVRGGDLWLLAAFGVSWLLALGMTHYAFTGDPHGLSGWWPVRQALRHALTAAVPALIVGALAWWVWPDWTPRTGARRSLGVEHLEPRRLIDQISLLDLMELLWRGAVSLVFTMIFFMILIYFRRWLLNRRSGEMGGDIMPDQIARLEVQASAPERPAARLGGPRGLVVALWQRWAAVMAKEGLGRRAGETAAQYAERLGRENPNLSPPEAMTELLERAHYGPDEPPEADVNAMREHVHDELSRLSLKTQKPMEPIE